MTSSILLRLLSRATACMRSGVESFAIPARAGARKQE